MRLRPDLHGTDGFFAAVFERKKPVTTQPKAPAFGEEADGAALA